MPEYFDISLIQRKTDTSKEVLDRCLLENFGLEEGENKVPYFGNRKVLVSVFQEDESDFDEICIGFPEQTFHKDSFDNEVEFFTSFVTVCFQSCPEIEFALCSYELNGYLLRNTKKLKELTNELLNKFPIVYRRQEEHKSPLLELNLGAQEILR